MLIKVRHAGNTGGDSNRSAQLHVNISDHNAQRQIEG